MDTTWLTVAQWMLRAGVGGGPTLALSWLAMRRVRQPGRRQRLGEAGLLAALALAVLALWPAWIPIHYGDGAAPRVEFELHLAPLTGVSETRAPAPAAAPRT